MTTDKTAEMAFFQDTKPIAIRIWHWLTFVFISGSIITVLLASTLFKTRSNISMVQEQVQKKGGTITPDQARNVAHEYSDKLWMLHKYIGIGLCFLLLFRIITEVAISKDKRLRNRIRRALSYPGREDGERKHYLLVQYSYVVFYLLFILMALTGLVLAFEDVAWLEPIHSAASGIHSTLQYFFYAYILFHLVGVIRADLTNYGGIVSSMINGKKDGSKI